MRACILSLVCFSFAAMLHQGGSAQEPSETRLYLADTTLSPALPSDVTRDGKLVFQSTSEHRDAELSRIVRWTGGRSVQQSTAVCLADGSWLSGSIQWLSPQTLKLNSEWFESIECKLDDLRGVLLHPSPAYRQSLELTAKMAALTGSDDTIWNKDAEQVQGLLSIQWRASTALVQGRPTWFLKPASSQERIELREQDLVAVAFSPVLRKSIAQQPETPLVTLRDGSRLRAVKLNRLADGRLQMELSDGFTLKTLDSIDQFLPSIATIQAAPKNVSWLSDLEPARYRLLDNSSLLNWPLGRDADLYGKRLWLSGLPIEHSLVVHSPAQVAYRWDGRPGRFLSEVQLMPHPGAVERPLGSARCQVLVARQGELKPVYRSEIMRTGSPPQLIDVDIEGVQLVVLLVEEADQGTMGDHVLWREARFVTIGNK